MLELFVLGLVLIVLLALNAFFVLAEFAVVKVRPSRVTQLAAEGDQRAVLLLNIQAHLDEYLSVCQVGITLASVALGMVGEQVAQVLMGETEASPARFAVAMTASFLLISGSHILLGELIPKSVAIRLADRASITCAKPLRFFHRAFLPALWVLTHLANSILRLFGMKDASHEEAHSEEELRIILDQSQERGMMSFRRLLFMENVFDLGSLTVRDAMRQRSQVRTLDARRPWLENLSIIRSSHFTRYPLITADERRPEGFVHIKDLIMHDDDDPKLAALARPLLMVSEDTPIETLFADMQRRRIHLALVTDAEGQWTGFVTLEDLVEELVGTIRDEFEDEEAARVADALTLDRVHFEIKASSPSEAVRVALDRMEPALLPLPAIQIAQAVEDRERLTSSYFGQGIGLPHARIQGLGKPLVMILRSEEGIACGGTTEKARLLIVVLTPAGQPRVHQRLQSIIVELLQESEYVKERLLTATSAEEVLDVVRTGEQAALG